MNNAPARDALDDKANRLFAGKVVRKDLVRKVKTGANVPVFVLEFLLGKYCASSDEMAIQMGLQVVNETLANNYIRADESMKAQSRVKEKGRWTFIDKVKVRLVDSDYWAEAEQFRQQVRPHPDRLRPQLRAPADRRHLGADRDALRLRRGRQGQKPVLDRQADPDPDRRLRPGGVPAPAGEFTTDEWIDLIVRSMGYEPAEMTRRLKFLFLTRLIPLCERNYNLVELGPRGTGKSYVVQEVSPYAALMTGPTTVANLFGHMGGRTKGLVQIWDVVGFDEVADLEKMPKEVITTMKTYCESGQYQRGQEAATGEASIAMFGNTNQPIDVMVQTGHLFEPMPDVIRDDMAFIDRLHFYLPGWEIPKMRNDLFTDHYGFVVDYLAEALRELRKHNFTEIIDRHFSLGSHLVSRDRKAVKKTVSGLMKIIYPHGQATKRGDRGTARIRDGRPASGEGAAQEDGLLRVLPDVVQLYRRGNRRGAVRRRPRARRPEPDLVRPAGAGDRVRGNRGGRRNRRYVPGGGLCLRRRGKTADGRRRDGATKESINRAFSYMLAKKSELGIARELDVSDLHVEVIDLLNNRVEGEIGLGFFVAAISASRRRRRWRRSW